MRIQPIDTEEDSLSQAPRSPKHSKQITHVASVAFFLLVCVVTLSLYALQRVADAATLTESYAAHNTSLLAAATAPAAEDSDRVLNPVMLDEGVLSAPRAPEGNAEAAEEAASITASEEETAHGGVAGEINIYTVQEGDTLSEIAAKYDISSNTILWANDIKDRNTIQPGDTLVILPISGVQHTVQEGDTLSEIAEKYGGDVDEILAYNNVDPDAIRVGDEIVVPNGLMQAGTSAAASSGYSKQVVEQGSGSSGFVHPLPSARRTQGIHGYNAVDLAAPTGTTIRAAAGGTVVVSRSSGYNGGYGQYIVIRHANGVQTLYAHMSYNSVSVGATVGAGEAIGSVGNTGRSTGPHLHFEVRGARNPF